MLVAKPKLRQTKIVIFRVKVRPSEVTTPCFHADTLSLVDWICHSLASSGCVLLPGSLAFLWTAKSVKLTLGLWEDQYNNRLEHD